MPASSAPRTAHFQCASPQLSCEAGTLRTGALEMHNPGADIEAVRRHLHGVNAEGQLFVGADCAASLAAG